MIGRTHLRGLVILIACSSLLVIAACSSNEPTTPNGALMIAVEGPQTGEQAGNGLDQLMGVQLAVKQLNASGGLWDGRKVSIFPVDDQADESLAKGLVQQVTAKGIRFLIGPYNSSVGLANLALYRQAHVLPLWMTSRDETAGFGATVQPMNTQIAPIEARFVEGSGAERVAMLVDDTANGAFTMGMATRLEDALKAGGASITSTSVLETTDPGTGGGYYAQKVAEALATHPDLVYVSTYYPEGVEIAKALTEAGPTPRCLMGLANVDNGFIEKTTLAEAQRCDFSGVPAAPEMASASTFVHDYRAMFGETPGVWGSFTYDSAGILFAAIDRARSYDVDAVERELRRTTDYQGATGSISIDPKTGYRTDVPVSILRVDDRKRFVVAG